MKSLPAGLAASLASGVTTLCHCWVITRTDGLRLGFTDHDEDVDLPGVTCSAESGATASAIEQSADLSVDGLEIMGALTSGRLAEAELARGLFDGAAVEVWRVDWTSPADRVRLLGGTLGEVSRGSSAFTVEVRSLADALNQSKGRLYQRSCNAAFGDARCGMDATSPAYRATGTVITAPTARSLVVAGLGTYAPKWFTAGRLVWISGANAGGVVEVRGHARSAGRVTLDLWEPTSEAIGAGDAFTVTAGCDKARDTCRAKFANSINFRGFPHLPGNDYVAGYVTGGAGNDGGQLD